MNRRLWGSVVMLAAATISGALACKPTQTISTSLDPASFTMAAIEAGAILPENCNDWTSNWQTPEEWWNSLPATQPPRGVNNEVVGFEIKFDTRGNCQKARLDLYRPGFSYDLSGQSALKGLVKKAEVTYWSAVLPSGVSPSIGSCEPVTGGGRSLLIVQSGAALPAAPAGFVQLPGLPPTAFPASGRLYSSPSLWQAGTTTTGLPTGVKGTTVAAGNGLASFTIEVTPYVVGAIDRGDGSISFMLGGTNEAPFTVFPAGPIDCKTWYHIGALVIEHY